LEVNVDLTRIAKPRPSGSGDIGSVGDREQRPTLAEAFRGLDSRQGGLLKSLGSVFAAVGIALRDIRQGNSRTFD
jgi:hypothetical protein